MNFLIFLKKVFYYIFSIQKRKMKLIFIILLILIFLLSLSFNLTRDIYKQNSNHGWENFKFDLKYNVDYINYKFNDIKESQIDNEIRFIGLKSMFLGIITCVILLSWKKNLIIGISLGVFLGACIGAWFFILTPSLIYFLELLVINIFKVK
ncbi:hypothetical protein [Candidatus Phytoplasma sacchari]|uniref:Uncharacterized protein n=1 Tax=Candidatus Phytoplasma sacchari TaxID=2609813 RepID=A0ABY7M0X5_9MOLU|nr:hypothetical protein O7R10_02090 [Candidatus Phytoplasma sacchari]